MACEKGRFWTNFNAENDFSTLNSVTICSNEQPAAWSWLNMTIIDHKFDATYHPKFTNTQNHFNSLTSRYLFTSTFTEISFILLLVFWGRRISKSTQNSLVDPINLMRRLYRLLRCNAADCNATGCLQYATVQINEIFVSLKKNTYKWAKITEVRGSTRYSENLKSQVFHSVLKFLLTVNIYKSFENPLNHSK